MPGTAGYRRSLPHGVRCPCRARAGRGLPGDLREQAAQLPLTVRKTGGAARWYLRRDASSSLLTGPWMALPASQATVSSA